MIGNRSFRWFSAGITSVLLAVALASGCGDETGGTSQGAGASTATATTATGGGGAGAAGGGGSGAGGGNCSASCDACKTCAADGACSAALATCSANPECGELSGCVAVCGQTTACVATCAAQHPVGIADYKALANCVLCEQCPSCTGCDTMGCIDGQKNGAETAVDCGGGECAGCADGNPCAVDGDCAAAHCVEALCCDTACGGACQACSAALTGVADGTCGPLPVDTDPADECPGADVCNGVGGCRCSDGVVNGAEVAVDCGGGVCSGCADGTPCSKGSDCGSGNCVDSVCCDTACTGACSACSAAAKGGGADGVCGSIADGSDPDAECNSPAADVCNGSGSCRCSDGVQNGGETAVDCGGPCAPCNGTCMDGILNNGETDVDCGGPNCAANCANGKACDFGTDCQSTFCVDGMCCNSACGGTCQACSAAKTDASDGTCAPVTDGLDPDNECSDLPPCGTDGACNGGGACGFYPAGGSCGDVLSCSGTTQTNPDLCNGMGACTDGGVTQCPPYACGMPACKSSCGADADCSAGNYCAAPACVPKKANGAACGGANQCLSGNCAQGVCCATACSGNCHSCNQAHTGVASGTCANVSACTDPFGACVCGVNGTCACNDNALSCGEGDVDCGAVCGSLCANGKGCNSGADCSSGFCVNGGCCSGACSNPACKQCNAQGNCVCIVGPGNCGACSGQCGC